MKKLYIAPKATKINYDNTGIICASPDVSFGDGTTDQMHSKQPTYNY